MNKPVLKDFYIKKVFPDLMKKLGCKNKHQVPSLTKVVLNSSIKAVEERTWLDHVQEQISLIAGQNAVKRPAKKSISNFKLREGMPIAAMATLRGAKMYEFVYKFISIALPNVRDFRGVTLKFDGNGNCTIGVKDHTIFPEIRVEGSKKNMGLDVTIVTSAKTDEEAKELFIALGFPVRNK